MLMVKLQCLNFLETKNSMKHYIYGAGGHGKVVLDALLTLDMDCAGFVDDQDASSWMGLNVHSVADLEDGAYLHLAIGNAEVRKEIATRLANMKFFSVNHIAAVISKLASVGDGTFVAANAIVGPGAQIGSHCIINHSAVVDHDCIIGSYSHVAPQSSIGGGVTIGEGVLVGTGAVVLPGIKVADYAVIGAGAVVTKNIVAGATVVGAPAINLNK